ncbi:MAG: DUF5674 family protein [Candidatus Dependentiae bacterium]
MTTVTDCITIEELKKMSENMFDDLVKAVVDIEKEIMVVDAEMHADQEYYLLENESKQKDLWGINLFPYSFGTEDFIIFDSMINLRPSSGNRSRIVENPVVQEKIKNIVHKLVKS